MAIVRTYQCSHCSGTFDELHMNRNEPPPAFCKLCGHSTAMEPQITAPNLNSAHAKTIDGTVQAIDEGAKFREQKVEALTGEQSSSLVLPSQNLHEGEAVKFDTSTPVHKFMADHAKTAPIAFQNKDNVVQYVRSMKGQPDVGGGLRAMKTLTSEHALRAAAMRQSGQSNK